MSAGNFFADDEEERLRAVAAYRLPEVPTEEEFDRIVRLAARLFDVPMVLISLIDRDIQLFKARVGVDVCATPRGISFCTHTIMRDDILHIPDATKDERFRDNPMVRDEPNIRFYAGAPLKTPGGHSIGSLCLVDHKPRHDFPEEDRRQLRDLADLVMDQMEIGRLDHARGVSQARFENIASTSPDAIICADADGAITYWNHAAETLFGYSADEALGRPAHFIFSARPRRLLAAVLRQMRRGRPFEPAGETAVLPALRRDGRDFAAEFSISSWKTGDTLAIGAIVRDLTERRDNEDRLYRLASLDTLTGVKNRAAMHEHLDRTVGRGGQSAILMLDIDGFNQVNDMLGHSAGDRVLRIVAHRITGVVGADGTTGRFAADEFLVALGNADGRAAEELARALIDELSRPCVIDGHRLRLSVGIGIALAPEHGTGREELCGAADLALRRAKARGRGQREVFRPELRQSALARRTLEHELTQAYGNGQFELYYQPQISLPDGRITGAEALIRWNHPQRGLLAPAAFLGVLDGLSLAKEVGDWTIRTACRQAAVWTAKRPDLRVAMNLFEAQFRDGEAVRSIRAALAETGVAPRSIEIEITENTILGHEGSPIESLGQLGELGVGLAFDDYGTGYASLSLLKRFPLSRLKIDKSFVSDIVTDTEDAAVVRAIIFLAKSFDFGVIGEGVEREEQQGVLEALGCDEAQGYLYGRPVPAPVFEREYLTCSSP